MGLTSLAAAALLSVLQPAPVPSAPAASPPPEAEPDTVDEVVVEGRRRRLNEYVREQAAPTKRGRLGRWTGSVCPGVVGLPQKYASYLVDRIAIEAQTVGLRVGEPGCDPDIIILMTDEPERVQALRKKARSVFAYHPWKNEPEGGGGKQTLDEFLTSERPVRWWHVSQVAAADGRPMGGLELEPGVRIPVITGTVSGRLQSNTQETFARVIVIVDTRQLKGVTYEALASYLAMVTLAQLEPEAEPGALPSILALFRDRDAGLNPVETLTEWDRAYLKGLYAAPANARGVSAQRGAIRRSLETVGRP